MKSEKEFIRYLEPIKEIAKQEGYDTLDDRYVEHLRARYFGNSVVIGESKRVRLRELKMSDLEKIYKFAKGTMDPVLNVFLKQSVEESVIHFEAYIAHMYPMYDYGIWAVEQKNTGEVLGLCGLGQIELDGQICTDLGYYICSEYRNQGLATECIEIVLDYAKNYLEFLCIYAIIKEENRISARILRKFGFEFIKELEDRQIFKKELAE